MMCQTLTEQSAFASVPSSAVHSSMNQLSPRNLPPRSTTRTAGYRLGCFGVGMVSQSSWAPPYHRAPQTINLRMERR